MKKQFIIKYELQQIRKNTYKKYIQVKIGDILLILYRYKYFHILTPTLRHFIGICISKKFSFHTSTLIIRNMLNKEGIELQVNALSKSVLSIKKIKMSKGYYVRNKLYYLRNRIA